MECVVCGGTEFAKDSGFYFCTECQTQSQEVKEHAFQDDVNVQTAAHGKKIKDTKSSHTKSLTSWEIYNVILLSLTEELINLGADRSIKKIVKCLWIRYLEKLEVLNLEEDQRPKLAVVNIKRDLRATFGRRKRKRKPRSSSESSFSESISRRERTKKKTALAKSEYSELSSKTEDVSLMNETLASLKSSDKSDISEKYNFNKYGVKELRRRMSKEHIKIHEEDTKIDLTCHRFTHRASSKKYKMSVYYISPLKLYCILYIALLIKKDTIQLGDLFRFLREGHLNFNRFSSLFADSYPDKAFNVQDNIIATLFCRINFTRATYELVELLDVEDYISCPNLLDLLHRYCEELNLPADICSAVENIIARNPMEFRNYRKPYAIPNYEARVMSLIIFVLKLLFGLDGVTENKLSDYAQLVNTKYPKLKMFDIRKWLEFISYRNLVVSEHHFPSYHATNSDMNLDLFLQYKLTHNIMSPENAKVITDMIGYRDLLTKIRQYQNDYITHNEYPPSLKPFSTYLDIIMRCPGKTVAKEVLESNFRSNSLECLLNPMKYLPQINKDVSFNHGGANDNWVLKPVVAGYKGTARLPTGVRKFQKAELVTDIVEEDNTENESDDDRTYISEVQKDFEESNAKRFRKNMKYLKRLHVDSEEDLDPVDSTKVPSYDVHYNPYERYWLYLLGNIDIYRKPHIAQHCDNMNTSFRLILNECARIVNQDYHDVYKAFQGTEMYLTFCGQYKRSMERIETKNKFMHYIKQAEKSW